MLNTRELTPEERAKLDELFNNCDRLRRKAWGFAYTNGEEASRLLDLAHQSELEGLELLKIVPTLAGYRKLV